MDNLTQDWRPRPYGNLHSVIRGAFQMNVSSRCFVSVEIRIEVDVKESSFLSFQVESEDKAG